MGCYFLHTTDRESYLEDFESAGQCGCFGVPQSEENVEKSFPVVLLKHDLLTGLRRLRRCSRRFPLLARVLDQALAATKEFLRLCKIGDLLTVVVLFEDSVNTHRETVSNRSVFHLLIRTEVTAH